jgi:hypothetical protein
VEPDQPIEDPFQLPEELDPALKRLFNQLLEDVMSAALHDPELPRASILAVVDRLATNLREHWSAHL